MKQRVTKTAVIFSFAGAAVCAMLMLGWYLTQHSLIIHGRPHTLNWEIVSLAERSDGKNVTPGSTLFSNDRLPLIRAYAWCVRQAGGRYHAFVAVQLFFLLLLMSAEIFLAWRLGGPLAAGCAPWIVVLSPGTLALAANPDDQLALQALIATAFALLIWSDHQKRGWLSWLSIVPLLAGTQISVYGTNAMMFFFAFACGAGGFLAYHWVRHFRSKPTHAVALINLCPLTLIIGLVLAVGLALVYPHSGSKYYIQEINNPRLVQFWQNPLVFLAYPVDWFNYLAGPAVGLATLAGLVLGVRYNRSAGLAAVSAWLCLPMLGLSLISKRQDFYFLPAAAAAYPLAALGLTAWPTKFVRHAAILAVGLAAISTMLCSLLVMPTLKWDRFIGKFMVCEPYLTTPFRLDLSTPAPHFESWVARNCAPSGFKLLIVTDATWALSVFALQAWIADPRLEPVDLIWTENLGTHPRCIVTYLHQQSGFSTLAENLGRMHIDSQPLPWVETRAQARIEALKRQSGTYQFRGGFNGYALFVPREP